MESTNYNNEKLKYKKILNNLLDIKGRDKTIFTVVNGSDSFDIISKFGKTFSDKILFQSQFSISLKEVDIEALLLEVKASQDGLTIIELYDKYKEKLSIKKQKVLEDEQFFNQMKNKLIEELESKIQKLNTRWKQFRRKVIDTNIQHNIWPLHIATIFISIKTNKRVLYAPLLLREVQIEIKGLKIIIKTEDTWKINEKLVFLLNNYGFSLDEKDYLDKKNIKWFINFFANHFNNHSLKIENLNSEFKNIKKTEIKNEKIEFHNGMVLGLFKPSGGHIRKTMHEIIKNREVDEIISTEPNKNIYKKNITNFMINKSNNLLRIQKSNFSQDKALSSALIQDTIIWGPPGTGKSQVIANLIVNILYNNKKAVVMSQKKSALDVLKKRLGKIAIFTLFILNDNKMKKNEFYKPLQKFVKFIENSNDSNYYLKKPKNIITEDEIQALKVIGETKKNNKYMPSIEIIKALNIDMHLLQTLYKIEPSYSYPSFNEESDEYFDTFIKKNNIPSKKFLFWKWYPKKIKLCAQNSYDLLKNNINIEKCKNYIKKTDKKVINSLITSSKNLKKENIYESNEEYLVRYLSKNIMSEIYSWKNFNPDLYKDYKKFANAVRAGRALPYKFINKHKNIIRQLFPIIITTPETSFVNWKKHSFDYAILDESSQIFLEIGLPILYLSKIKVLAGDNQQMQPSRWFTTRDDENEDEEDLSENADSVLNYAFDKGVHEVMLNKNYRSSSAALMSFSAKQFYNSELEVIDDKNNAKNTAIEVININGKWENTVNELEAKKTIDVVKKNIKKYEKVIILTFNSKQRQLIEKIIIEEDENNLVQAMDEEKLLIRNIENIQGDEANLVIATVGYDSSTSIGSTYVARNGGKNALNVAISRAKDKMIVIKSVNSNTLKPSNSKDFKVFQEWLRFLDMKKSKQKSYSEEHQIEESHYGEAESNFEIEVIEAIKKNITTDRKMTIEKQYPVGSKRIDIAIIDLKKQYVLGIEVDGYKYHGEQGIEKYCEDHSRQDFIESKGYKIFRIKEIDWCMDKNKVLANIQFLLK